MSDTYLTPGIPHHVWIVERYLPEEKQWFPVDICTVNPGSSDMPADRYRVRRATVTVGGIEK